MEDKKILWLDEDVNWIKPYVDLLEEKGYSVTSATNITEAEKELLLKKYDLLILDVMIPPLFDNEDGEYYDEITTASGSKTGVIFFQKNKGNLDEKGTQVLVMTARIHSKDVKDEFVQMGLPESHYSTKLELDDARKFLEKIGRLVH